MKHVVNNGNDLKKLSSLGATMISQKIHEYLGGGFKYFFMFTPTWGNFSDGLKPPARYVHIKTHSSWSHLKHSSDQVLMPCAAEWLGNPVGDRPIPWIYPPRMQSSPPKKKCSFFRVFEWSCWIFYQASIGCLGFTLHTATVTTRIIRFFGTGFPI